MAKFGQEKAKLYYMIERKQYVIKQIQDCVDYVTANCFYCNKCWYCLVTKKLEKEADKKKLKSSDVEWWSIKWTKSKKGKTFPSW